MIDKMTLTARINELTSIIGAPDSLLPQIGLKNDLAYPYIELDRCLFYYIVREKGEVLEQRPTSDLEELLFWIFQDVTFQMAMEFERKNRVPQQDFRRILWSHQLQLLERLRPEWRMKRQQQIDQILETRPFSDSTT